MEAARANSGEMNSRPMKARTNVMQMKAPKAAAPDEPITTPFGQLLPEPYLNSIPASA